MASFCHPQPAVGGASGRCVHRTCERVIARSECDAAISHPHGQTISIVPCESSDSQGSLVGRDRPCPPQADPIPPMLVAAETKRAICTYRPLVLLTLIAPFYLFPHQFDVDCGHGAIVGQVCPVGAHCRQDKDGSRVRPGRGWFLEDRAPFCSSPAQTGLRSTGLLSYQDGLSRSDSSRVPGRRTPPTGRAARKAARRNKKRAGRETCP